MGKRKSSVVSKVDKDFWKNKKVFLTGHTGFKGSWLSLWLHKMGARVIGYSLAPTSNQSMFIELNIEKIVETHIANICDYKKISSEIKEAQPDIVIHMAAQALVKYSYENPLETFQTNVVGTANVLQACRGVESIKAIVSITSDKCYENVEKETGYKESDPMGGHDPYSSSKGCAELVTASFRSSFFNTEKTGIASARAGNVIGGGDWAADRLVPDIFRAILLKKPVLIRNPHSMRPWQHVLEPLSGYLILAQRLFQEPKRYSVGFNFGPLECEANTVEYVVSKITSNWGDDAKYETLMDYSGPHEAKFLKLDITKARTELSWSPSWNLDQAIEGTTRWYKKYIDSNEQILKFSLEQIDDFQNSVRN